jgi:hypothetical protein
MVPHNPNYVGGDIMSGSKDIRQLTFGPRITLSPYRVGVPGSTGDPANSHRYSYRLDNTDHVATPAIAGSLQPMPTLLSEFCRAPQVFIDDVGELLAVLCECVVGQGRDSQ